MPGTTVPADIKSKYLKSMASIVGTFRLDGMPEAGDLFYREVSLEDIYLPLRLSPTEETLEKLERHNMMWEEEYKLHKDKISASLVDQEQLKRIDKKLEELEKDETSFRTRAQISMDFLGLVKQIDQQLDKTRSKAVQPEKETLRILLEEKVAVADSKNENRSQPEIGNLSELQDAIDMMIAKLEKRPGERVDPNDSSIVHIDEKFRNQQLALYDDKPVGPLLPGEPSRRVVLSEAGNGKTTLSKRVALAYANDEKDFKTESGLPGDLFPVLLQCNWLNGIDILPEQPFLDVILNMSLSQKPFAECLNTKDSAKRFADAVLEEAQNGTLLLIIDGFDEIFDDQKQYAFAVSLSDFLEEQKKAHLLITSRVATFHKWANAPGAVSKIQSIPHIRYNNILKLSREGVADFCKRWYSVLFPNDPGKLEDAERIIEQLNSPRFDKLSRMVSTPLHLSTILLITRRSGKVPNNKYQLYGEYLSTALNWHSKGTIDAEDTLKQLAYIAVYMMKAGIQRISENMLEETLLRCYNVLEGFRHPIRDSNVKPFIEELEERTCLLQKSYIFSNESVYRFTHMQLQEYLAAYGFVFGCSDPEDNISPLVEVLSPHFRQTAWREVIVLALMMCPVRDKPAVILRLIDEAKNTKDNYYATNLLFEIITDGAQIASELKKRIYDLIFKEHITDLQIRDICDYMHDERSESFANYISDKFAASIETGNIDYSYAMATISAYRFVNMGIDPLAKAQEMVFEEDDIAVVTGLSIFCVLGWCKYCEIKNVFRNYDIKVSRALSSRMHNLLAAPDLRVWGSAAIALTDMLISEYAQADDILDEAIFVTALGVLDKESKEKSAQMIISMFPINYQTLLHDTTIVPSSLKEKYLGKYREEFQDPEKAEELVFTFCICALLGCWPPDGEALMEEFTNLEGYYSINKKQADDASKKRLAQLRKQIYSLADPANAGYQFYADHDYVNARAAFLTALSRGDVTVKNNLAYMLRRGEIADAKYEGVEYTVPMLLKEGIEEKEPFSLVNYALYETFSACPVAYDAGLSIIRDIDLGNNEALKRIYAWWLRVAEAGEAEGFIVLLWLLEIGAVTATPYGTAPEIKSLLNNNYHIII